MRTLDVAAVLNVGIYGVACYILEMPAVSVIVLGGVMILTNVIYALAYARV